MRVPISWTWETAESMMALESQELNSFAWIALLTTPPCLTIPVLQMSKGMGEWVSSFFFFKEP